MAIFALFSILFPYLFLTALVTAASQLGMLLALCVVGLRSEKPLF